jgi:tRNA (mo5U34)-methyltransferase
MGKGCEHGRETNKGKASLMIASRDDVQYAYRIILGREPAPAEVDEKMIAVEERRLTAHQLGIEAISSDEFRRKYAQTVVVPEDRLFNREEFVGRTTEFIFGLGPPSEAVPRLGTGWFHSFRLSDGTLVNGNKSLASLQAEFDLILSPLPVAGRTVLDIGAWNGAFSFEAKLRGAVRVLASDLPAWTNPALRGFDKFLYVRRDQKLDIEYKIHDVSEICVETVGRFDIVLFLGVFYHLKDPIKVLSQLAEITESWLVIETHLDLTELAHPAMRYYPGDELGGDSSNWWGPNPQCIDALLMSAGFTEVRFKRNPLYFDRGIFHAHK